MWEGVHEADHKPQHEPRGRDRAGARVGRCFTAPVHDPAGSGARLPRLGGGRVPRDRRLSPIEREALVPAGVRRGRVRLVPSFDPFPAAVVFGGWLMRLIRLHDPLYPLGRQPRSTDEMATP
jgi:hypothetical protein